MEKYVIYGLIIALVMATVISLYASSDPDGLEWVAEILGEKGEWNTEEKAIFSSLFQDYSPLAGLIGVVIMFLLAFGIGKLLKKKNEV